ITGHFSLRCSRHKGEGSNANDIASAQSNLPLARFCSPCTQIRQKMITKPMGRSITTVRACQALRPSPSLHKWERAMADKGIIRTGTAGWVFEPWRGSFFPEGLVQKKELHYASRHLTSIEINATFRANQKPASFVKWAGE